jgi:DNA polymerase-3 subunit beta
MKITASAGALHRASALADAVIDDAIARKIPALGIAHIKAGAAGAITLTTNNLNGMLTVTVPTDVTMPGAVAVPCVQLADLVGALPADSEVSIEEQGPVTLIAAGRRRFKLPTMPLTDLPAELRIDQEIGRVVLERAAAAALLTRTSFAVANDARQYLGGVLLHNTPAGLTATATDGRLLARFIIPGAGELSSDHCLIVPAKAIKIIARLLGDKAIDHVTLRRSSALFAVETASVGFICRRIDGTFPDYQNAIPAPSASSVSVDRAELKAALTRVAAVADQRAIALAWANDELRLSARDAADDVIEAEVAGAGQTSLQTRLFSTLLDKLVGSRVGVNVGSPSDPALITDDDANFLAVLAPCGVAP